MRPLALVGSELAFEFETPRSLRSLVEFETPRSLRSLVEFAPGLAFGIASVFLAGCGRAEIPRAVADTTMPSVAPVPAPEPPPEPPALEGAAFEKLDLGHGETAYAAVPVGARDKRVVVVGVHGAGDHADWACSEWKATTADWAFVVCPQGLEHPSEGYVWGSATAIAAQADRAVAALRARYGAWMTDGPLVYAGWSQGATLASQVVAQRPGTYDRVALVEVGHTPLDANAVVATFAASGVRRAVVSCSSGPCRTFAQSFERAARRRNLPTQTNDIGNRGHWFDEPVFRSLGPKVVWMVDDEPRFAGLGAAVEARWMTD